VRRTSLAVYVGRLCGGPRSVVESTPLLAVRDLRTWFRIRGTVTHQVIGTVKAVDGISFDIGKNEVLGLAGESGSGKTTTGRSILRLIEPTSGQIFFDGADVVRFNRSELRSFRRNAQIIFQDPFASLDPRMSVEEIITEPLVVQGFRMNKRQRRERAAALLEAVALSPDYLNRLPRELSGGQCQRVGIARALSLEPKFIVADEPVSALDVSIQAQVITLLEDLIERLGLSLLFVSHDLAVMEYLADRIAVMYLGKIMEVGPSDEVCGAPKHPYTQALLSAVPRLDDENSSAQKRIILTGDIPNAANPPSGCVFRTRCPYAIDDCASVVPLAVETSQGHYSACIRHELF
jgi:oligopeptide/dipeptide ABC transporter ATP-binding protein